MEDSSYQIILVSRKVNAKCNYSAIFKCGKSTDFITYRLSISHTTIKFKDFVTIPIN